MEGRERGGKREGLKVKETETDLSPKNGEKWESYGRVNSANTKLETKTRLACIYGQYYYTPIFALICHSIISLCDFLQLVGKKYARNSCWGNPFLFNLDNVSQLCQ